MGKNFFFFFIKALICEEKRIKSRIEWVVESRTRKEEASVGTYGKSQSHVIKAPRSHWLTTAQLAQHLIVAHSFPRPRLIRLSSRSHTHSQKNKNIEIKPISHSLLILEEAAVNHFLFVALLFTAHCLQIGIGSISKVSSISPNFTSDLCLIHKNLYFVFSMLEI